MKTAILRTLATLSLSAVLGSVSLQAKDPIHVTVPFDFTVGSKSFAAGEYRVKETASHVLAIQRADGQSTMMITANAAQPSAAPGIAVLMFNKYGDRYFLSQVSDYGNGWELTKPPAEKELIAKARPAKPVTLVAGK